MTAARKGPIERAVRAELRKRSLSTSQRGLAASAVALAARADDLPDCPDSISCSDCGESVPVPDELRRPHPKQLTELLAELRQTMTKLTEGTTDRDPLADLSDRLGAPGLSGPPVGHPEAP